MREPPRLADADIVAALHAHYGLQITELTFLALGADSASAVYRARAGDATYFLKMRTSGGFSTPSLAIPHYLHSRGVPHIVAPLPTISQALWVSVGAFALSLSPFLEARTGTDAGLSQQQWRELGATLKQIHSSPLTPGLRRILRREAFIPWRRNVLDNLQCAMSAADIADGAQRELAAFWRSQQDIIHAVVGRCDALARQLRPRHLPRVLCHADLHTWNVLLDADQQMWIVDWDETILAPKERDLMFVIGGIGRGLVSAGDTACFLHGYGDSPVDQQALVYYRYAWAVQDMAAYGEQVFFAPELTERSRHDALHGFTDMFQPGNIVEIARASG